MDLHYPPCMNTRFQRIIFVQISIQRSSNIFEATKRTIWKDVIDLFIKYLYMYINYKYLYFYKY